MGSTFDPGAAVSGGQGQGNAFSGIYTNLGPETSGTVNLAEYGPEAIQPGAPHLTDPAKYEKYVFSQVAGDPEAIKHLQQQLKDAGYQVSVTGLLDAQTNLAYEALLQDVSIANEAGQVITPDEYLQQKSSTATSGGGGTTTQTSTSFTSATDARAAAIQAFESALGKRPSQKQLDAFYSALHAYEAANPTVTSQTQHGDSFNTTTSDGTGSVDSFAQQYVDQNFGGQVGTHDSMHYFNIIADTLAGPPGAHAVV